MEWLTSAEGMNARQKLEASIREHHPNLRDEEVDLIMDGRLIRMVRERAAEQAPASGQQGGIGEGGAEHKAPGAVGIDGGAVAPTIDTGMIGASYGQFKFGAHLRNAAAGGKARPYRTQLAQLRKGDDETAESYCNRARTIRAELLTIGQEVHMATFAAHVLKGLPPEYGFLRRKLDISSPDMTVEHVCSEVLMEEQTLSIKHSKPEANDGAASLKTYVVGSKATPNLWHARLGHVHFDAVKRTAMSGGVFGMDLEKGEDGPLEDGGDTADLEADGRVAVDEQPPVAHAHEPSLTAPPIQPIPQPPRRSSRPNKGVPPVRFQPSALTAQDADDEENPYNMAYLAEDDCDTDSDDKGEYPDEDEEEEGAWGGVILDLAAALTRPGSCVDRT
ncbi:unnamed protein product [Closterium sp. NIES-64]|nr:unnamed protein product [Closterium sp. NIES-64]